MKKTLLFLALLPFVANAQQSTSTDESFGSLTPKSYKPLFQTRNARKVGDILTVIISESSNGQYQANMQNTKKDSNKVGPNEIPLANWLGVGLVNSLLSGGSTSADSQMQSQGTSTQTNRLSARMSVTIKQIMPNGVFVVEGTRAVKINRETQQMTLSGMCRLDDIRLDNTLLSENLANAEIKSEGIGMIYQRQRRGFVTKLMDWLF
jgi:flagellar L-ring protein precursor FlgH